MEGVQTFAILVSVCVLVYVLLNVMLGAATVQTCVHGGVTPHVIRNASPSVMHIVSVRVPAVVPHTHRVTQP